MSKLLKLAWRNVQRNRRRTIITASAIILGVTMMLIVSGIISGMLERTVNNSVELETGHIKIFPKGYYDKSDLMPTNLLIKGYSEIINLLDEINGVKDISPRIKAGGVLQIEGNSSGVVINGIDPEEDSKIRDLEKRIIEGEKLVNEDANFTMIGETLANKLKIELNDEVLLSAVAANGSAVFETVTVKAIFSTGLSSYDGNMIFLSLPKAQNMLKIGRENVTEIVVMVDNPQDLNFLTTVIKTELMNNDYDFEVFNWEELAPDLAQFVEMEKGFGTFFLLIVLFIASSGILNTMLMAVYERVKEVGVMAAFGYKRRHILILFLWEGLIIGIIGAIIGYILGLGITYYLSVTGIDFAGGAVVEFFETTVYPKLSLLDAILPFILAMFIALLASFYPAYKASKLEPVEALRHV
ncbi:MAG: ABC transporter permease [Promethearchaeota archaeon]